MDVVRRSVETLGGTISMESTVGTGTRFRLKLPLTLAMLDGQLLRVGALDYVLPLGSITESLRTVAVNKNAQAVGEARRAATVSLGVAVAAALAIGIGFAVVIARSITRPLSEAVAGQTTRVLATSQEMAGAAEQLSRGAQEQASSLEETAASLEEMTSTGKQN